MAMLSILLKASALLAVTLAGTRLLRHASGATRHALWSVTFLALLALPWLAAAVPAVPIPLPAAWTEAMGCGQLVPGLVRFCGPDGPEPARNLRSDVPNTAAQAPAAAGAASRAGKGPVASPAESPVASSAARIPF